MNPAPTEVRAARAAAKLTQAAAAQLMGVDRVTWARWETGERNMSREDLRYFRHVAGIERMPFKRATSGQQSP